MKEKRNKIILVILISLSIFSTIYLDKVENTHSETIFEMSEIKQSNDQLITNIKFVSLVVEKFVDIVTTRRS